MREEDGLKLYLLGTGDQAVMAQVFDTYAPRVKQFICNRAGKGVDADELTHEAFVKLYRHARSSPRFYSRFETIGQFLVVLTAGVVRDFQRRQQREERHEEALKNAPAAFIPATDAGTFGKELYATVKRGLRLFRGKRRHCVELLILHGYSVEEAAVLTGTPSRTVRTWLSRARAHLRDVVNDYWDGGRR